MLVKAASNNNKNLYYTCLTFCLMYIRLEQHRTAHWKRHIEYRTKVVMQNTFDSIYQIIKGKFLYSIAWLPANDIDCG